MTLLPSRRLRVCWLAVFLAAGLAEARAGQIVWDPATLTLVQRGGSYARMIVLSNGEMLCGYSADRKIWVRRSADAGRTWRDPALVAAWTDGNLTNTELLQLRDGTLLCFFNQRPSPPAGGRGVPSHPYAICSARSADRGLTWQPSVTLYSAGPEFENGCWEPSAIQTPAGEVQLFFANEGPYRHSNEQEITLLRSGDGGRVWTVPERVSFRPGNRDGMPVPLALAGGKDLVFSIEDTGLSGTFKPVIIHTTALDNWRSGAVGGNSPERWGALQPPLPPGTYAGAPYLRQMPGGETVLSFQVNPAGKMPGSRFAVSVGDAQARNFSGVTYPFPPAPGGSQLWGSLVVKNRLTVTAVCDAAVNGARGIWSIDGRLAPTSPQAALPTR